MRLRGFRYADSGGLSVTTEGVERFPTTTSGSRLVPGDTLPAEMQRELALRRAKRRV